MYIFKLERIYAFLCFLSFIFIPQDFRIYANSYIPENDVANKTIVTISN